MESMLVSLMHRQEESMKDCEQERFSPLSPEEEPMSLQLLLEEEEMVMQDSMEVQDTELSPWRVVTSLCDGEEEYSEVERKRRRYKRLKRARQQSAKSCIEQMLHAEPENPTNAYKEFHAWWEQWRRYRYLASPTVAPGGKPLPITVSNFYGLPSREGEAEFLPDAKNGIHKTLDTFPSPKRRDRRKKRGGREEDTAFLKGQRSLLSSVFIPANGKCADMVTFERKADGTGHIAINILCTWRFNSRTRLILNQPLVDAMYEALLDCYWPGRADRGRRKRPPSFPVSQLQLQEEDIYLVICCWTNVGLVDKPNVIILPHPHLMELYTDGLAPRALYLQQVARMQREAEKAEAKKRKALAVRKFEAAIEEAALTVNRRLLSSITIYHLDNYCGRRGLTVLPGKRITKAPYIAAIAEHAQRKNEKRMKKMQQQQQELSPIEEDVTIDKDTDNKDTHTEDKGHLNPNKRQRTGEEGENAVA